MVVKDSLLECFSDILTVLNSAAVMNSTIMTYLMLEMRIYPFDLDATFSLLYFFRLLIFVVNHMLAMVLEPARFLVLVVDTLVVPVPDRIILLILAVFTLDLMLLFLMGYKLFFLRELLHAVIKAALEVVVESQILRG